MRTLEEYNDFVRRKCELSARRVAPPKAPIRRPTFARARFAGGVSSVKPLEKAEALTDIPLVGHAQRLTPTARALDEEEAEAKDQETQASMELPLEFSKNAITAMESKGLREEDVRKYINEGVIKQRLDVRDMREVARERDLALKASGQVDSALLQRRINDGEIDVIALQSLHSPHAH